MTRVERNLGPWKLLKRLELSMAEVTADTLCLNI